MKTLSILILGRVLAIRNTPVNANKHLIMIKNIIHSQCTEISGPYTIRKNVLYCKFNTYPSTNMIMYINDKP